MIEFLTSPYPINKNSASTWAFTLGTGAFVALFLIVFQPFGTRDFQSETKYLFLAGYGLVTSAAIWLCGYLPQKLFPRLFDEESWTVGKHILFTVFSFSFIFLACYVYKDLALGNPISIRSFIGFFPVVLSISVFPITGLIVGDYVLKLKRNAKLADHANAHLHRPAQAEQLDQIVLSDENGKPVLELQRHQLLFLQAADNYVEVFHLENHPTSHRRTIIRNSLAAMETGLANGPLYRCHRSYLVNLSLVERLSGNAQGYRLHFAGLEQSVPVARGRSTELLEKLR